jgi:hypothetical protein
VAFPHDKVARHGDARGKGLVQLTTANYLMTKQPSMAMYVPPTHHVKHIQHLPPPLPPAPDPLSTVRIPTAIPTPFLNLFPSPFLAP